MTQQQTNYQHMLEALSENKRTLERPKNEPQLAPEMYLKAPDVYLTDYLKALRPLPGEVFLIGKVVDDGQPLLVNLRSENTGRILHIMSDDWTRMEDFVNALAYGIEVQFKPFNEGAEVSYAAITYHAMEWAEQQKRNGGCIPLLSTGKEKGPAVKTFIENMITEWKSKRQTGFFFIRDLHDLAGIPDSRDLMQYLDHLINTPDKNVRFVFTSRRIEYFPPPGVTPLIGIGIDYASDFYCRDGRFKIKLGSFWKDFDILRPK